MKENNMVKQNKRKRNNQLSEAYKKLFRITIIKNIPG